MAGVWPVGAVAPDFSIPKTTRARMRRANFGDGYSQRGKKGINNLQREWMLGWSGLTDAERATIESFLETQGGLSFTWTPNDDTVARLVSCEEWSPDKQAADVHNLKARFVEEIL